MADVTIKEVAEYFKIGDGSTNSETGDPRNSLSSFAKEWKGLPDDAKAEIKAGVAAAKK